MGFPVISRWLLCIFAAVAMIASGASYSYGAYSGAIKTSLHLSQSSLADIGLSKQLGGYLLVFAGFFFDRFGPRASIFMAGFLNATAHGLIYCVVKGYFDVPSWTLCLLFGLLGFSSGWFDTPVVGTAIAAFPFNRGLVIGLLKAFNGFSVSILLALFNAFFKSRPLDFLLFLSLIQGGIGMICGVGFPARLPKEQHSDDKSPQHNKKLRKRFYRSYLVVVLFAVYVGAAAVLYDIFPDLSLVVKAVVSGVIGLWFIVFFLSLTWGSGPHLLPAPPAEGRTAAGLEHVTADSEAPAVVGSLNAATGTGDLTNAHIVHVGLQPDGETEPPPSPRSTMVTTQPASTNDPRRPLLADQPENYSATDSEQATTEQACQEAQREAAQRDRTTSLVPSLNIWQVWKTLNYWLMWLIYVGILAGGNMVNLNIGQIVESAGGSEGAHWVYMSIISVFSCFGRLFLGFGSDKLAHLMPRTAFLVLAAVLMAIAQMLFAFADLWLLYPACALMGFCYGSFWALKPNVTSELFGLAHFGSVYFSFGMTNGWLTSLISTKMAGWIYEKHISPEHEEDHTCYGVACFQLSFFVTAALNVLGLLAAVVLTYRTRKLYRALSQVRAATIGTKQPKGSGRGH